MNLDRISDIYDKVNFYYKITHILQYMIDILSKYTQHFIKTHRYYNFWHIRRDGPVGKPKNIPQAKYIIIQL